MMHGQKNIKLYLEMSIVFGLSIYTATANSCNVGNENILLGFLGGGGVVVVILIR
jgi:hypothetical protein